MDQHSSSHVVYDYTVVDIASRRVEMAGRADAALIATLRKPGKRIINGYWPNRRYVFDSSRPEPSTRQLLLDTSVSGRIGALPKLSHVTCPISGVHIVESDDGEWFAPANYSQPLTVHVAAPGFAEVEVMVMPFAARRATSYPMTGEQLDAIAKGFAALRSAGVPLPDDTVRWLDEIAAVKAAHPKG